MESKSTATVFIETLGDWFNKFPPLSKNWKDTLVRIIPIITLISGLLGIIFCLMRFGFFVITPSYIFLLLLRVTTGVIPYGLGYSETLIYLFGAILLLLSYPGTSTKKATGWKLLFWSETVNLIAGLLSLNFLTAIIWALVIYYLLFQIRSYYKLPDSKSNLS